MSEQTAEAPIAPMPLSVPAAMPVSNVQIVSTVSAATTGSGVTNRAVVVEILASMGERPTDEVPEWIDSMALAWLVHQVEQRYGTRLELDGEQFVRMGTVNGAVDVLNEVIVAVPHA